MIPVLFVVWFISCTVFTRWQSLPSRVRAESSWEQWVCDTVLCSGFLSLDGILRK